MQSENLKRAKIFLGFTFALTWISWWMLSYLTQTGIIEFRSVLGQAILIVGGSAPTVGAYVAVALTKMDGSLEEFNSRVFKTRVNPKLYIFAVFTPVALGIFGLGIASTLDSQYLLENPLQPVLVFIPAFLVSIVMGGIEEVGWRGVLQPSLTKHLNLVVTNFIVGIIWSLWHLPLFYVAGTNHQGNSFFFFTLAGIGYSGFLTWLYAKTKSVFLCVLFHAAINATASIGLTVFMSETPVYYYYSVFVFIVGFIFLLPLHFKNKPGS